MHYGAQAYARASRSALSPREAEAAVLLKAAARLQALGGEVEAGSPSLNEALVFNQRVWTVIAGAATEESSPLPADMRDGIGRLSVFVFRTIVETMIEPTPKRIAALVSLNNQIAAGLQGNPGSAPT